MHQGWTPKFKIGKYTFTQDKNWFSCLINAKTIQKWAKTAKNGLKIIKNLAQ